MKECLVILDPDQGYGNELKNALNRDPGFPFHAAYAATTEEMEELVLNGGAEVVLSALKEALPDGVKTGIFLSDVPGYANGAPSIFKYQPAGKIRQEILKFQRVFEEADDPQGKTAGRITAIGVASPVGRAFKTSFSLVLGQLVAQNAKTLYVDLEPCPGFSALFGRKFPHDLSELFYEGMKEDWDGRGAFTETVHGLDVLAPAAVPEDIYGTDPPFIRNVILKYAEANGYETVIFDLGTEFRVQEAFVPALDKLYIPVRKDPLQEEKVNEYREWLARVTDPGFEEKTEVVTLPVPGLFSRGKYDPEQLLFTELGDYVRNLLGGLY